MIVYSAYNQGQAWWNVIILTPIALFFFFTSIYNIREIIYLDKQRIVVDDRVKYISGAILGIIISFIILSDVLITIYTPSNYLDKLEKGEYYVAEGQPEKVEPYVHKTGSLNGFELTFNLEGIEFDTGLSYGERNRFNEDVCNRIKNGTIRIKYIYENIGPVILELSLINEETGS